MKEQFVYRNEASIQDSNKANERIKDYLFWYNTKRYHRGLNYQTLPHYSLSILNPKKFHML